MAGIRGVDGGHFEQAGSRPADFPVADLQPVQKRILHKGEHFCRIGDRMQGVYAVRAGILKCYRILDTGEEQVLGFHLTGDSFGFDAIASGVAPCNIVALDSTSISNVSVDALLNGSDKAAIRRLVESMSREILRLGGMLHMERCLAEKRMAIFILQYSDYEASRGCCAEDFALPMSRRDLARYLHLTTETISRVFGRLQQLGFLDIERNHVRIINIEGLRDFAFGGASLARIDNWH